MKIVIRDDRTEVTCGWSEPFGQIKKMAMSCFFMQNKILSGDIIFLRKILEQ